MRHDHAPNRHMGYRLSAMALVCTPALATATPLEITVVDGGGNPLADAVVSVEVKGVKAQAPTDTLANLEQRNRTFMPKVLAVQTGTAVSFPNFDTVRHHVYSFSPMRKFEIKLYAGTPAAPLVFDKAGTAVLGCNIHDRMSAFIHVVNTPYFAKTDAAGTAVLELPAGQHVLQAWHPMFTDVREPVRQDIKVEASGKARMRITLTVSGASS